LLQKSFCEAGLKFSDPLVQRLNNDVGAMSPSAELTGDSGSACEALLIGDCSLVSFFGGKLAAAPFGTFATISARSGNHKNADNAPPAGLWPR
jgi:hypothetical protein